MLYIRPGSPAVLQCEILLLGTSLRSSDSLSPTSGFCQCSIGVNRRIKYSPRASANSGDITTTLRHVIQKISCLFLIVDLMYWRLSWTSFGIEEMLS